MVKKIALTGGPCAGKTTALTYLTQKLGDYGFYPLFVPEAATLLIKNRITPLGDAFSRMDFQRHVLSVSLALEAEAEAAAARVRHPRPVIITDRGIPDQRPYLSRTRDFEQLLKERGLDVGSAKARYDAAMHLRTAALGAEEYYTLQNNDARYETAGEARRRDERTLKAWLGHEHFRVIGNDGSFEKKLKRLLAEICVVLGIPEPVEIERKFLVKGDVPLELLGAHQTVRIEQFYLPGSAGEGVRLRKREQYGVASYYRTEKRPTPDATTRYETQEAVSGKDYAFARQFIRLGTRVVRKERTCFVYENQVFELDRFLEPELPFQLLEIELAHPDQPITLPPFLAIEREVTDDPAYGNFRLAHRV